MRTDSRPRFVLFAITAALAAAVLFFGNRRQDRPGDAPPPSSPPAAPAPASSSIGAPPAATPVAPPFAERILADYADPARPPEQDMDAIAHVLGNFALLVKGADPLPLGANEEIAAALRGKNKAALRALSDGHPVFNAQGQLVDRWRTPLYFHASSRDRLDIRSAGPDRVMWTGDDFHRKHDGRYLRGEALLAPSLFEEPPRVR